MHETGPPGEGQYHGIMCRASLLLLIVLLPAGAQEYNHRVAGSFGGFIPAAGSDTSGFDTAPVASFHYGYRFNRYGSFDAGVDIAFASRNSERTNIYVPSVGYRVIVPLWNDRIEASLAGGGAYSFFKPKISQEVWLVYGELAANYALDADRRYRAGFHVRWYRDPIGRPAQQWVSAGAEISYHFGR